jgi:hypothetical protein
MHQPIHMDVLVKVRETGMIDAVVALENRFIQHSTCGKTPAHLLLDCFSLTVM